MYIQYHCNEGLDGISFCKGLRSMRRRMNLVQPLLLCSLEVIFCSSHILATLVWYVQTKAALFYSKYFLCHFWGIMLKGKNLQIFMNCYYLLINELTQVLSRSGKADVLTNPHRPYGNNKVSLQEIRRIREAGGWVCFCSSIFVIIVFAFSSSFLLHEMEPLKLLHRQLLQNLII